MHIAYVINQYPQASQSFIRREIAALEARGLTIHRFTVRRWNQTLVDPGDLAEQSKTRAVLEGGKLAQVLRLIGATLVVLLTTPVRFFGALRLTLRLGRRAGNKRALHLIYLAEACVLLRWIRVCGAGHIHAHFGTNSTAVAMLIHSLGGPRYSFTVHGPEEFDKPEGLSLGEKIERCAFVVAISQFGRSQLCRWVGYEQWPRIHIVRCGVDAGFLENPSPPPANDRLVCVGRFNEQKGQLVLIEAAALLKARDVRFHITLIGDGPMRGVIEARIAELELSEQIRLTGWMSNAEVRAAIVAARAMVLPSFAEGLPVVLMESLALHRPVITTSVAGIPELVQDGVNGLMVPPGDAVSLSTALEQMLTFSLFDLAAMGEAGAKRVGQYHDASAEAAKLAGYFAVAGPGH